ncbi:MAG: hypothetical protein IJW33_00415 [Lentisphaeria bacterium]|nr:hypothetical protein [Lentisphaeria bacterium]
MGVLMTVWKKLSLLVFSAQFLCAFASDTAEEQPFADIRKAAEKCAIYSDEDHALGAKLLAQMKEMALKRTPVFSPPQPVMEGVIYRFGRLYYTENSWFDRQLFANRKIWNKSSLPFKKSSLIKTFQIMNDYGAGLSYFYAKYYKLFYEAAPAIPGFKVVPTLFLNRKPELPEKFIRELTTSDHSLRADGKAVILSYGCDRSFSPKEFQEYVEKVKKSSGREDFTIVAEFTENCHRKNCGWNYSELNWPSIYYRKTGKVSAKHLLFFFDILTGYLKSGGGIDLAVYAGEADFSMSYRTFDGLLLPLCGAACAQKGFDGKKILCLQIMNGYSAANGAQTLSSDGTLTARKYLELCKKYKVDIPMGFEWDELNELTNWEPTVARPMALMRIFKYYMGEKPAPLPGDDTSIPNFIISQRRQLPLGTMMTVEVLNIPDGVKQGKYDCLLELTDHRGETLWQSEKWSFDAGNISDKRFHLPTEKFADARIIAPRLTVEHQGKKQIFGDGLPFTVLRAGVCTDQSWSSTPLRNVLPLSGKIAFREKGKTAPGISKLELSVDVKSPEKLSAVEAVQNSVAVFAYDKHDEYLQNDTSRSLYRINYRYVNDPYKQVFTLTPELLNAPSLIGFAHSGKPTVTAEKDPGKMPEYKMINGVMVNYQLFSVKKAEIPRAVLKISGTRENGPTGGKPVSWQLPLKDLEANGIYSRVFEDGLAVTVEKLYRHARLPLAPESNEIKFTLPLLCDTHDSVVAARFVSEDGKVYWSKAFLPETKEKKAEKTTISTRCDQRGTIKFQVDPARLPEIDYHLDPRCGDLLVCDAGREFYAQLGSYTATAISFEGELGSWHTFPFILMSRRKNQLNTPAPAWIKESDGSWALDFDGKNGNFLAFPGSVFSQRSGFELSMDILPRELEREQIIFRQYGPAYQTGFCLKHRNGKLTVTYRYRIPDKNDSGTAEFPTGLQLSADKYQKITMKHDGETLTVTVDGKKAEFSAPGTAYWSTPSNFGGDISKGKQGKPSFFNGKLKSFKVKRI